MAIVDKNDSIFRPRTLDLFCGGGGSSWGAKAAGAELVCGVDAWELATQTYERNFPGARGVNLRLDENSDASVLGEVGHIDLIMASPECTHHTCARGSRPRDENSKLTAHYVLNFAKQLNPRWIVIENVIYMLRWHGYSQLVEELERLGYHVKQQVLNATDFGVPQNRRRLFLICDREAPLDEVLPTGPDQGTAGKNVILWDGGWISKPLFSERRAAGTLVKAKRALDALPKGVPFLIVYYGTDGSGGWQPLDRPIRTLTTLDRFGLVTWEGETAMLRMLQVPELQRAMGFNDGYVLPVGSRRDRIRLLGNSVCPPVMEAIVRTLKGDGKNRTRGPKRRSDVRGHKGDSVATPKRRTGK